MSSDYPEALDVLSPVSNGSTKVAQAVPNPIQDAAEAAQAFLGVSGKGASWNLDVLDFITSILDNRISLAWNDADTITVKAGYTHVKNAAESVKLLRKQAADSDQVFSSILGSSTTRTADTAYLVWAVGDVSGTGLTYEITDVQTAPDDGTQYSVVGGFCTDSSSDIIEGSIWSARGDKILSIRHAFKQTKVTGTTSFPYGTSNPTITQGTQIETITLNPSKAGNKFILIGICEVGGSAAQAGCGFFKQGTTDAFASTGQRGNSSDGVNMALLGFIAPATTGSITFEMRAGMVTGTYYINGGVDGTSNQLHGGSAVSGFIVIEVEA